MNIMITIKIIIIIIKIIIIIIIITIIIIIIKTIASLKCNGYLNASAQNVILYSRI